MSEQQWRYEIRGSNLYDLTEQRVLSLAEAGEILNAHQHLLITSGVWAGKAGLAEATIAQQQARIEALEARIAELDGNNLGTPSWAFIGRDGEPVTLLQKLEQSMEFGSAMEKLAIENNQVLAAERERADALQREKTELMNLGVQYALEHRDELARHEDMWVGKWQDLQQQLEKAEEESDKWFVIAAAQQDVKALLDRNVKLREWLESSDGMMAKYERLAAKYRDELQAEREKSAEYEQLLTTAQPVIVAANLKIERLEALAGLALKTLKYAEKETRGPIVPPNLNKRLREALATQAPEAK